VVVEGGILRMGTEENVRASFRGSPVEPSLVDRLSLGQNGMFSNSINVNANDIESVYKRARGHESQFVWEGVWTLRRDDQAEAVDRQVTEALTKFETQPGFSKAVLCKLKHQHLDRQAMFSVTFDGDAATQEAQLKQIMAVVARAESVE
jgi:hypothetical protein